MSDQTITTTAGQKFTGEDSKSMARLVYRRFGNDLAAATVAWCRMLQNFCTESDFATLLETEDDRRMRAMGFDPHDPTEKDDAIRWVWNQGLVQVDICDGGEDGWGAEIFFWEHDNYGREILGWTEFCNRYNHQPTANAAAVLALRCVIETFHPVVTIARQTIEENE